MMTSTMAAVLAMLAATAAALCNKNGKLFKYIIDFMPFVYCKSLDFFIYAFYVPPDISVCFSRLYLCVSVFVVSVLGIILLPKPINNAPTTMFRLTLFFRSNRQFLCRINLVLGGEAEPPAHRS